MGKNERKGKRKSISSRRERVPELGYYLIVTDTKKTEKNYFEGLKKQMPDTLIDRISIKVEKASTTKLIDKALDLRSKDPQYRLIWIVFDRDQVKNFDHIIENAEKSDIMVGWSNPCIEIFFNAYFGQMPTTLDSVKCCREFDRVFKSNTSKTYEKSMEDIYKKLIQYGDEDKAIQLSKDKHEGYIRDGHDKPSDMISCTTLYMLVEEINLKI